MTSRLERGDFVRIIVLVIGGWLVLSVVLGSQTAMGLRMQGTAVDITASIRAAMSSYLPWIPATLLAIAMAVRFPIDRRRWRITLPLHLLAIPAASWLANVGVVLSFWVANDQFNGFPALASAAAFWGAIQIHVALLVYTTSAAIAQGWLWLRDSRAQQLRLARMESQLSRARYQALSAQMRPHFLFNTLHTIGQLWRSGRDSAAEEMLDHLGSLFQRVHTLTDRSAIRLDEEFSMVREYLAIEEVRFADRLTTEVFVSEAAADCLVPPLILQPIVENAIRHGIGATGDSGLVSINATIDGERLLVVVCDDGPGMDHPSPSPGSGTGLPNTTERLRHAFGDLGTVSIEPWTSGGTCVQLSMPAKTEADEAAWDSP